MKVIIGGAAFFAALGIVGTVERGGDLALMWWACALAAVAFICFRSAARKDEQNDR